MNNNNTMMANVTIGGSSPTITWSSTPAISTNAVYTTNGTGGYTFANIAADPNLSGHTLHVKGNAEFDGDVTINGKNLTDMFAKIEERLAILHPNPKLEDKWDELKELGKRYKELEAEIIEKEKMWAILKR